MDKTLGASAALLASLRALLELHRTHHWQASGPTSYSDHLLFQRIYEPIPAQVDTLAEKLVALYGSEVVHLPRQLSMMQKYLQIWTSGRESLEASLFAEQDFQKIISKCYNLLKASGRLTLGLDDFLMSLSSEHDTAIYLLRQRSID